MVRRAKAEPAPDTRVVQGLLPTAPRVQVKFVDAGDLYVTWRWEHALDQPRALRIPRGVPQPVLDELERAVPSPMAGEDVRTALERALAGPFGDPEREQELTQRLVEALLPYPFAMEINELLGRGIRPHLRIQPSRSLGRVPWEALLVDADEGHRMVHDADVSVLSPAAVRNAPGRTVSVFEPDDAVARVLDPPIPGGVLAPVLDAPGPATTRGALRAALDGAARFVYVGHVSSATHGLDVRMHLSDDASSVGRADLIGPHRPLTAADIAFGADGEGPWRIPARVALIACESGGDMRFAEPTGLVSVMVRGGAEHVTAARWTLPTDAGLAELAGGGPAFSDAVAALDAAHAASDPVSAVGAWQAAQADLWASTGSLTHSPIVWGAFATTWAPGKDAQTRRSSASIARAVSSSRGT